MGDVQCIGLAHVPSANTPGACCAACADDCETWQFCAKGQKCAGQTGVPLAGGCYVGK